MYIYIKYDLLKKRITFKYSDIYLNENVNKDYSNIFYNTNYIRNNTISGAWISKGMLYRYCIVLINVMYSY